MSDGTNQQLLFVGQPPPEVEDAALRDRLAATGLPVSVGVDADTARHRIGDGSVACLVVTPAADGQDVLFRAVDAAERPPVCCLFGGESTPTHEGVARVPTTGPEPVATLVGTVRERLAKRTDLGDEDGDSAERPTTGDLPAMERVLEEAPVGVTIADATTEDYPLIYVNEQFEATTGYEPEAALGRNCRFLQGPETEAEPVAEMRAALAAEESTSVVVRNYRADGEPFWNEVSLTPLRDADGTVTHYLGFQNDVTDRKRAEDAVERYAAALEDERQTLATLLDRVDDLVEDVTGAVVSADTRSELGETVCERLRDAYASAWMGTYDPARDRVTPEWRSGPVDGPHDDPEAVDLTETNVDEAGVGAEPSDGDSADVDDVAAGATFDGDDVHSRADGVFDESEDNVFDESELVARAVDTGRVAVGARADDDGSARLAVVPLVFRGTTFGVICIYAGHDAFGRTERRVLAPLGRTVAIGLHAIDTQRTLTADEVFEVEFAVNSADAPLVHLARAADCELEYTGAVTTGGRRRVLCSVSGASGEAVLSAVDSVEGVTDVELVADSDSTPVVGFTVEELPLFRSLGEHGLRLVEASFGPDGLDVVATGSRELSARSFSDALERRFDDVTLRSFRNEPRTPSSPQSFVADVQADLSDRQRSVLRMAHATGYFEWPHAVDGSELASALDVSRPTFHQHLRAAQRKLVSAFFAEVESSERARTGTVASEDT